jgi:diacylglycerol kinase family enzyme
MSPAIGVVTNPHAHAVASDAMLPRRLAQIAGDAALVVETHDLDELGATMREFAARGVEVIACCGGDGTNVTVLTEMVRVYGRERLPAFAILRGGTVNTVANNLGIRGTPEDILTRLVACRNRGMPVPAEQRSLLCVNGSYGFFFGAAMPARFYEEYYRGTPGLGRAAAMAARLTASALLGTGFARRVFEPVGARITVDGNELPNDRWTLIIASTLMDAGLKIRITYRAFERAGHFHLVATGLAPSALARQFHRAFLARGLAGERHFDQLAKAISLEFDRPQAYMVEGDLFQASRVTVTNGPRVRLSVP